MQDFPRIVTPLVICHPLVEFYKHYLWAFGVESWCCRHAVFRWHFHGSEWWELPWPISNLQSFRDLSCLLGFCLVCLENFPATVLNLLCELILDESVQSGIWEHAFQIHPRQCSKFFIKAWERIRGLMYENVKYTCSVWITAWTNIWPLTYNKLKWVINPEWLGDVLLGFYCSNVNHDNVT